jgi:two-component system LytT family response regulator
VTRLRALIVDDERLARNELRRLLAAHPEVEACGEAGDVNEALASIDELRPDVVFLDIQMPGQSGFDLLARTTASFRTVFVTAYDEHALRAFEVNALDYLLKPVNPERLQRTVDRLVSGDDGAPAAPRRPLAYDDHLFVTSDRRARFVKVSAIACLTGAGDYAELHTTDDERLLVPTPLREWEERLPHRHFARVHRAAIVNLDCVEGVEPERGDSFRLKLRGVAAAVPMSRRYAARLKDRLG